MIVNLSHIDVVKLHQAEIRAEVARNHLIEASSQAVPPAETPRPITSIPACLRHAVGSICGGLRQAIASLAALASIG